MRSSDASPVAPAAPRPTPPGTFDGDLPALAPDANHVNLATSTRTAEAIARFLEGQPPDDPYHAHDTADAP